MSSGVISLAPFAICPFILLVKAGKLPETVAVFCTKLFYVQCPHGKRLREKVMCKNRPDCNLVYGPHTVNIQSFLTSSAAPIVGLSRRRNSALSLTG